MLMITLVTTAKTSFQSWWENTVVSKTHMDRQDKLINNIVLSDGPFRLGGT